MTRRSFAAMAALAVSPRIRAAVIGTGHGHAISKIRALRSMPEYDLVGVCRPDPNEPNGGHQALQGLRALTLAEIAGDESIEMVAIESADTDRNLDYAEQFVKLGRWVHFDKPPGADFGRFRALLAEAQRRGRIVQMGYQWRYHPAMAAVVEAAARGWLGEIYRFRASIDKFILPEERRHLAKHRGGMMFSEGCHLIDRAVAVLGKPQSATGFLRHDSKVDDTLADNNLAVLSYPRAIAEVEMAGFHKQGNRHRMLEVRGTNGSARMQPYTFPSKLTVDLADAAGPYKAGEQEISVQAPAGLTYTHDFAELAAVMRNGAKPLHSAQHDLDTHETLLRVCGMLKS